MASQASGGLVWLAKCLASRFRQVRGSATGQFAASYRHGLGVTDDGDDIGDAAGFNITRMLPSGGAAASGASRQERREQVVKYKHHAHGISRHRPS